MSSLDTQSAPVPGSFIPAEYDKRLMVASGRASLELGSRIAQRLGVGLTDAGLKTFSDGEVYCRYADSIRGADLFIVQSTCGSESQGLTVNDAIMELMVMIHAAKHASAHRIIAVTPWYGYSRQDKKSAPREPITARLVAELLETAGVDRVVTMDLHAGQVQGFFSKPVDHMTAMPILTQYVQDQLGGDDLVIIAPDAGRVKLVRKFAQKVGAPYALLEKERPAHQVAEIGYVIGDVQGKRAVIVDDIIDTGGTLSAAAQTVLDEGASEVHAIASHGVFSGRAFETLGKSPLSSITVTDTIPLAEGAPEHIKVLTTADILTDSVRRIFTDDSVSIFQGENQLFTGGDDRVAAHRLLVRAHTSSPASLLPSLLTPLSPTGADPWHGRSGAGPARRGRRPRRLRTQASRPRTKPGDAARRYHGRSLWLTDPHLQ